MKSEIFADIYLPDSSMKISIHQERFKFYTWVSLAYLLLGLLKDLINYPETFLPRVLNDSWQVVYVIVLNFILFEYTLPFIRRKRKNIFYHILPGFLVLWIHLILYSFGLYAWREMGIRLHIYTVFTIFPSVEHAIASLVSYSIASVLFFGIIKHIYDYRKLKASAQQLRIEKQEAELNYLKSQTNPHFLFNTLNNIYSLAKDKSDLAPESILRLSQILRFMLYETSGAYIAIGQELKIISDYIALEKLRYDDSLRISFNYDVDNMDQSLPPLLLIPLVENAFKHGVSETRHQPFVDIHLSVNQRQLVFLVKNSAEASPADMQVMENIGLSNLRRQLELLYTGYELSVQQAGAVFTAHLKINLASHA